MGATFCGEVQEENNKEYPKKWLGESGASSYITHKKKGITYVEKYEINITVVNGQKIKCELKGSVNMKLKDVQTVKRTKVQNVPQDVKNHLSVSRLVSKVAAMGPLRINDHQ